MRLHPLSLVTGIFVTLRQFLGFILVAVGLSLLGERERATPFDLLLWLVVPVVVSVAVSGIGYLSTRFYLTPEAAILDTGIVWKRRRMVPRARVQEVHLTQNAVQRFLGIVEVKIEGAGGGGAEITLSGLGLEDAESLRAQLTGSHPSYVYQRPQEPEHALSVGRIVWASMLENRALLVVAGLFGVLSQFLESDTARSRIVGWVKAASTRTDLPGWVFLVLVLLAAGWLASVVLGLWQFYGFEVKSHPKGLQISHGLVNLVTRVVALKRVQQVAVAQGVLFRLAGLCAVRVKTAGGEATEKATPGVGFLSPAATTREVPGLVRLVFPDLPENGPDEWRRLAPAAAWIAAVETAVLTVLLVAVPLAAASWSAAGIRERLARAAPWAFDGRVWWVAGAVALLAGLASFGRVKTVRYRLAAGVLAWKRGRLARLTLLSPVARLQYVRVTQSPFERRAGAATVACAFPGAETEIGAVRLEEAAALRNECLELRARHPGRGV
jgi:putative membrane protein